MKQIHDIWDGDGRNKWHDSLVKNQEMHATTPYFTKGFMRSNVTYWKEILKLSGVKTKGLRICDVGCGHTGVGTTIKDAEFLMGIEPDKKFFEKWGLSKNYNLILNEKIEDLEGYTDSFDVVFACQIFDHVNDPQLTANKIKKITKFGGLMVIEEKTYENWFFQKYYNLFARFIDPLHMRRNSIKDIKSFFPKRMKIKTVEHFLMMRDTSKFVKNRRPKWKSALYPYVWMNCFAILLSKLSGRKICQRHLIIITKK